MQQLMFTDATNLCKCSHLMLCKDTDWLKVPSCDMVMVSDWWISITWHGKLNLIWLFCHICGHVGLQHLICNHVMWYMFSDRWISITWHGKLNLIGCPISAVIRCFCRHCKNVILEYFMLYTLLTQLAISRFLFMHTTLVDLYICLCFLCILLKLPQWLFTKKRRNSKIRSEIKITKNCLWCDKNAHN